MDDGAVLGGLDPDQWRAVTTESTLVAVVAGAGSGKTRVLTRRVAHRVATGTADEAHTLVLTFTREAAGELRRRLPRLGLAGRVTAGTFHSVAHGLLQQRWRDLDQPPRSVAADRRRLVARITPAGTDVDALTDEIAWAGARGLTPAAYDAAVRRGDRRPGVPADVVVDVLAAYRRDKQSRGVVDLDDLLALTIEAMERDQGYADAQRWRFRHLLVDEAQDLNPLQHRLLDVLRAGRDDLYLVGDASQAIYGFNGSDPTLLTEVERRFPGIEIVRLPVNHRCTPQIVAAGTHVLATGGQPADLSSARAEGTAVRVVQHADEQAESDAVARSIATLDPTLIRAGKVAVLARTNAQLPAVARALAVVSVTVRQAGHGAALQPLLEVVFRLPASSQLRGWAHDTLDGAAPDSVEHAVGTAVLDYLRAQPLGDGPGLRAWIEATDPFGTATPGVELLTFHGAKGREWHTVHLVGCETGLVPHRTATTLNARAEEARLLYVAVTRATDELVVHWAQRRGGYQRRLTPLLDGFVSTAAPAVPRPDTVFVAARSERDLILERLVAWRADTARNAAILPEAVCTDAQLAAIADAPPVDPAALDALTGLGLITSRRLFDGIAEAIELVSS